MPPQLAQLKHFEEGRGQWIKSMTRIFDSLTTYIRISRIVCVSFVLLPKKFA
jgi:hypothetical protein